MIGLNWAMLIFYVTATLAGRLQNAWLTSLTGACMMTFYDFIMEPAAVKMGMWYWKGGIIPLQNYLAWFICSLILIRVYLLITKPEKNAIASSLLIIQLLFFTAIYLWF
jgi:putative membrane protein